MYYISVLHALMIRYAGNLYLSLRMPKPSEKATVIINISTRHQNTKQILRLSYRYKLLHADTLVCKTQFNGFASLIIKTYFPNNISGFGTGSGTNIARGVNILF